MRPILSLRQRQFLVIGAVIALVFVFCTLFLQFPSSDTAWRILSDFNSTRVSYGDAQVPDPADTAVVYGNPTETALNKILEDLIVQNANTSYHPDKFKDLDLAEFTRQTVIFKDIWKIYETLPPVEHDSIPSRMDRVALHDAIEKLQKILFPWLTKRKNDQPGVESLFALVDTFQQDAGIVIAAGRNGFRWAMHQVSTLRNVLNCNLPIEIFYGGEEDLPIQYRQAFEMISLNSTAGGTIRTIDIRNVFPDPDGILDMPGGWALRPFAVLASSFKKVILSDADTIFLQNPAVLLQEPAFREKGTVFYHDRVLSPAKPEVYDWVDNILEEVNAKHLDDVKKDSGWFDRTTFYEMESGAVTFDKSQALMAILMICHLNLKAQRELITYKKFYGDKESYWMGYALTSTPYYFVPGYSGGLGPISRKGERKDVDQEKMTEEEHVSYLKALERGQEIVCTLQILHVLESTGQPLWFNNGLTQYKGADNDQFIDAQGWVGHDGHWGGGPTRYPNEFCVEPKEGEFDRLLGDDRPRRSVNRFSPEMAETIQRLIQEARHWDNVCEELGLYHVKKNA